VPEQTIDSAAATSAVASAAARALAGVESSAVAEFLSALRSASERLGGIAGQLEAARVHDEAFGKLIDAAKVRDAYHERLPATDHNLAEARDVIEHFLAEFATVSVERTASGT
jgi:hypothetical protein